MYTVMVCTEQVHSMKEIRNDMLISFFYVFVAISSNILSKYVYLNMLAYKLLNIWTNDCTLM
jgi:hypothetical protein